MSNPCTLAECRGAPECPECSGRGNILVTVDTEDFEEAVTQTKNTHRFIMNTLQQYSFHNIIVDFIKTYYFKIMRSDNNNGILIYVPPYDLNNGYEVYTITNNKKNSNSCIKIIENDKLVHYILHTLFNEELNIINCTNAYNQFLPKINNVPTIFGKFVCTKFDSMFIILHKETKNGYMFSFYTDTDKSYIKIQIIQNARHFENHKTTYVSTSIDNIFKKFLEYMYNDMHNIKINCCKVIMSKYIEDNTEDIYNTTDPNNININYDMDPY